MGTHGFIEERITVLFVHDDKFGSRLCDGVPGRLCETAERDQEEEESEEGLCCFHFGGDDEVTSYQN